MVETKYNRGESDIHSLQDYLHLHEKKYSLLFYAGSRLAPFDLKGNAYQWILFPVDLLSGNYKLCLLLPGNNHYQPISAYGMVFAPGEKIIKQPVLNTLGYGFQITPAIASANRFLTYQNTTDFKTIFSGVHQIGITTTSWTEDVADTVFEVMLLRKKSYSEVAKG